MNRAGAVELLMPVVQPAELWQEIWALRQAYGARADAREGPARPRRSSSSRPREEVITDIARQELRSYRAAAEEISITFRPSSVTSAVPASA